MSYLPVVIAAMIAIAAKFLARKYTRRRMDPDRRTARSITHLLVLIAVCIAILPLSHIMPTQWAMAVSLLGLGVWYVIEDALIFGVDVLTGASAARSV